MKAHLGYYAHHHGSGHLRRAEQVLERCQTPSTLLTSSELASDLRTRRLALDVDGHPGDGHLDEGRLPHHQPLPSILHYAPIGHHGLRARTAALTRWFAQADPAALVVDVSVEVTLLARIAGVSPIVVRQHGQRDDPAHRAAYESAAFLLAFWPSWAEDPTVSREVRDRTIHIGALSRLAGRQIDRDRACELAGLDPSQQHVIVVRGFGGDAWDEQQLLEAAHATPDHRWTVIGPPISHDPRNARHLDVRGVIDDPVAFFSAADVVVTHGGQNAVADAAALGARLVLIPQPRPFNEQVHLTQVLADNACAVVLPAWPRAQDWPTVLDATHDLDRVRLASLVEGGAERAAQELDRFVAQTLAGRG